jgi:serine phosphatase RsbU (regulator of sigma subunit)/ligand-binding sensor domain-containing protein
MRRYFLIFLLYLILVPVLAQVNKTGIPLITNYSAFEFNFAEQNYCVVQDKRGIMYFGNNENGILEYDGVNLRKIPIPKNSSINGLAVDENGIVFVGAAGEFGYLAPNNSGKLAYISLVSLVDTSLHDIYIDRVLIMDHKVYFSMQGNMLVYDYHKIKHIRLNKDFNLGHWLSFLANNTIYLGTFNGGLMQISGDEAKPVKGGDFFKSKVITEILPYSEKKIIIGTYFFGIYLLDTETGELKNNILSTEANNFLKNNGLLCGQNLPDARIAFGTKSNGLIVVDKAGNIINHVDKSNGLQDEWVNSIYMNPSGDKASPLWLALNSGISKIEISSPLMLFGEKSGLNGQVLDVVRFNNKLYVCTSQGVYSLEYNSKGSPVFKQFNEPNTQCWSLVKYTIPGTKNEVLLLGTQAGIYQIDKYNNITRIDEKLERIERVVKVPSVFYLYPSRFNKSIIYVAELNGLKIITNKDGKWDRLITLKEVPAELRSIAEDNEGSIWLGTRDAGIFKIKNANTKPEVFNFNTKDGLTDIKDANPILDGDSIYITTTKGLFRFNDKIGRFESSAHFGASYTDGSKGIYEIFKANSNNYWLSCNKNLKLTSRNWIEKTVRSPDGKMSTLEQPFRRLPNKWIDVIYPDENKIAWFGMSNDLFCYNENVEYNYQSKFNALIRNINIGNDSSIFAGTFYGHRDSAKLQILLNQRAGEKNSISFKNNSVTFTFAATSFENEKAVTYSYFLKGFRETWSNWATEPKAVFTNLGEGDYEFKVMAKNIYGVESTIASYSFTVLPPWYRTIYAYIFYVIFSAALIWGIVKYNTRRLQLDKIRLEQIVKERTAEILKQKDELETQRDQIIAQKKDITDSIRYASRIQRAVLPSEKVMKEVLPDHFVLFKPRDIVSGDFYWMTQKDQKIILVAADCTGHGVPGAFMSMLGMSFLNEIVNKGSLTQANSILNELREHVITQLKQTGGSGEGETKDGMDLSLVVIDKKLRNIQFSGANNSMYVVRPLTAEEKATPVDEKDLPRGSLRTDSHELFQVNADKMPIGTSAHNDVPFSVSELPMIGGQTLYILSDGYEDQFGGPMGKKFLSKAMKRFLLSLQGKAMSEQRNLLDKSIEDWRGELDQVDDILVIGLKIQ